MVKASILALFLVLQCILNASAFDPSSYPKSLSLNRDYTIYWRIQDQALFLGIVVNTTGWVGFGISEPTSGSMPGGDIVTASVVNGVTTITDRHATAKAYPSEDTCQDWHLISGEEANGVTKLQLWRNLTSADTHEDRNIVAGPNRIIYAYGTSDILQYHESNRGGLSVTFFGDSPLEVPVGTPYWDLKSTSFQIPPQVTTYGYTSMTLPFQDGPFHMIGFEAILDPNTAHHVHHFILHFCPNATSWYNYFLNKTAYQGAPRGGRCAGQIWGWAPGMTTYVIPEVAGFRVGPDEEDYKYLTLEVHYDNPNVVSDLVDSSGVRIYYSKNLRQYDAAVLALGDPFVLNPSTIPAQAEFQVEYECTPEASSKMSHEINVFTSILHMHQVGSQIWSTQWRNGSMIRETNRIDFWDFAFQQSTLVEFTVQPGDRFNTHCRYDTRDRNGPTVFGPGSEDEMCIEFLSYYPRLKRSPYACGYGYTAATGNFTMWASGPLMLPTGTQRNPVTTDPSGGEDKWFGTSSSPAECTVRTSESASQSASQSLSTPIDEEPMSDAAALVPVAIAAVLCLL